MGATVKKLPLSGSEPTFTLAPFGTSKGIANNNCYAYALQRLRLSGNNKLQPGNLSGKKGINFSLETCHPAKQRALDDLVATGRGYESSPCARCADGYAKIVLLLSKNNDYHWLRENGDVIYAVEPGETLKSIAKKFRVPLSRVISRTAAPQPGASVRVLSTGAFSHKRGTAFGPSLYDAKGKVIFDPRKSNFDYGSLNYNKYCSSFCVAQKKCTPFAHQKKSAV